MSNGTQPDSSLVPVVIMGQTYKVRAEENAAYLEELARFVDTKMATIAEASRHAEPLKVAILAALNIADEFFKAEETGREVDEDLARRTSELAKILEASLREPTKTSLTV